METVQSTLELENSWNRFNFKQIELVCDWTGLLWGVWFLSHLWRKVKVEKSVITRNLWHTSIWKNSKQSKKSIAFMVGDWLSGPLYISWMNHVKDWALTFTNYVWTFWVDDETYLLEVGFSFFQEIVIWCVPKERD